MASPKALDGVIARLGDSASPQVIRAYHGSPRPEHFDKFDARYIGSGEGNQSYSFGHYVAQKKPVADDYRRELSRWKFKDDFLGALDPDASAEEVMDTIGDFDPRQQRFLRALHADDFLGYDYPSQAINSALSPRGLRQYEVGRDIAQELVDARSNLGTGYEVEVRVSPENLLDWDAPLASQDARLATAWGAVSEQAAKLNAEMARTGILGPNFERWIAETRQSPSSTGQALWRAAVSAHGGGHAAPRMAADLLHDAGVHGVQYLDQGSRKVGDGTRNFVVFPKAEDQIRILRKFAVPGVVGTGAAAMSGGE